MTMLRALAWCRLRGVPAMMMSDLFDRRQRRRLARGPEAVRRTDPAAAVLRLPDHERTAARLISSGSACRPTACFRTPTMIDEMFWRARSERASIRETQARRARTAAR